MIESLRGKVQRINGAQVVIECGGVGYGLSMSSHAVEQLPPVGEVAFVLVHTHLTQEALRLYGFVNEEEAKVFAILIATSGVGPKLALAILSAMHPAELVAAVHQADKKALTRIVGVGPKTAERLLIELRDRLPHLQSTFTIRAPIEDDLQNALLNLGFREQEAQVLAQNVARAHPEQKDVAELVRQALRTAQSA